MLSQIFLTKKISNALKLQSNMINDYMIGGCENSYTGG